ncbi:hypothetical protein [Embleya sp. NPDC020630]|uniref:hypothetical protein n=1 Tax=Embleya sp. NPDC020630 TaxID=3363979 RepID=UPI0037ADA16C
MPLARTPPPRLCIALTGLPSASHGEAAERLGHAVDVLLKIYTKCIDGQRNSINQRIPDGLGDVA